MTLESETSIDSFKPILNMLLVLLLSLFVLLLATFAYPKQNIKKIHESELKLEAEIEARVKKEMERAETGKAEKTDNKDRDANYGSFDIDGD